MARDSYRPSHSSYSYRDRRSRSHSPERRGRHSSTRPYRQRSRSRHERRSRPPQPDPVSIANSLVAVLRSQAPHDRRERSRSRYRSPRRDSSRRRERSRSGHRSSRRERSRSRSPSPRRRTRDDYHDRRVSDRARSRSPDDRSRNDRQRSPLRRNNSNARGGTTGNRARGGRNRGTNRAANHNGALAATTPDSAQVVEQNARLNRTKYCLMCGSLEHYWRGKCLDATVPLNYPRYVEVDSTMPGSVWPQHQNQQPQNVQTLGIHLWRFQEQLTVISTEYVKVRNELTRSLIERYGHRQTPTMLTTAVWDRFPELAFPMENITAFEMYAAYAARITAQFLKALQIAFRKLMRHCIELPLGLRQTSGGNGSLEMQDQRYATIRLKLRAAQGRSANGRLRQGAPINLIPLPEGVIARFVESTQEAELVYGNNLSDLRNGWAWISHLYRGVWTTNLSDAQRYNADHFLFDRCRLSLESSTQCVVPNLAAQTGLWNAASGRPYNLDELLALPEPMSAADIVETLPVSRAPVNNAMLNVQPTATQVQGLQPQQAEGNMRETPQVTTPVHEPQPLLQPEPQVHRRPAAHLIQDANIAQQMQLRGPTQVTPEQPQQPEP